MSFTFFKNKFNIKEGNNYTGMPAIKGDTGASGSDGSSAGFGSVTATVDGNTGTPSVTVTTSGPNTAKNITFAFTGLKGEGIGSGTFTPLVSYANSKPSTASNNTMWVKNAGYSAVKQVMCGIGSVGPNTRPDGSSLQGGDLYVDCGSTNNHPLTWGNFTLCPYRAYVWSGSAWVYKEAEIKVGGTWYPLSTEWYIENGVIVGEVSYPSTGNAGFTTTKSGNVLVFTSFCTSGNTYYVTIAGGQTFSPGATPVNVVLEGYIVNGPSSSRFGTMTGDSGGASTVQPSYANKLTISSNSTVNNPTLACTEGSGQVCAITTTCNTTIQCTVAIQNFYKVIV